MTIDATTLEGRKFHGFRWELLAVVIALALLSACGSGSGGVGSTGSTGPTGPGSTPTRTFDFTVAGNPLTVAPTLATTGASTVHVPTSGGVVAVTTPGGGTATLTIPPDALLVDTDVTMTPIQALAGMPFSGGLVAGVDLAPSGLHFQKPAELVITPAAAIATGRASPFGYSGNGTDFHLSPAQASGGAYRMQILHFSGGGIADGSAAERATSLQSLPAGSEARLEQFQAAAQEDLASGAVNLDAQAKMLQDIVKAFEKDVARPSIAAVHDCASGKAMVAAVRQLTRMLASLGITPGPGTPEMESPDVAAALVKGEHFCIDEAYAKCEQHRMESMIPTVLGIERQVQLLGQTSDGYGITKMYQCFSFTLDVTSLASAVSPIAYGMTVVASVPIRLDSPIPMPGPRGSANYSFTSNFGYLLGCTVEVVAKGNVLEVPGMQLIPGTEKDADGYRLFHDVELRWNPLPDFESWTATCPDPPRAPQIFHYDFTAMWYAVVAVLHQGELQGDALVAKDWTWSGGAVLAEKKWILQGAEGAIEETKFILRHTPGQ